MPMYQCCVYCSRLLLTEHPENRRIYKFTNAEYMRATQWMEENEGTAYISIFTMRLLHVYISKFNWLLLCSARFVGAHSHCMPKCHFSSQWNRYNSMHGSSFRRWFHSARNHLRLHTHPFDLMPIEECQPNYGRENRRSSIFTKLFVFLFCPFTFVHSPPFHSIRFISFSWERVHYGSCDHSLIYFAIRCGRLTKLCRISFGGAPVKLTPFRLMRSLVVHRIWRRARSWRIDRAHSSGARRKSRFFDFFWKFRFSSFVIPIHYGCGSIYLFCFVLFFLCSLSLWRFLHSLPFSCF